MHSALAAAFILVLALSLVSKSTEYLENHHFWTLRLRLSTIQHWFLVSTILVIWSLLFYEFVFHYPTSVIHLKFPAAVLLVAGAVVSLLGYALPAYENYIYLRVRWKAWTGPSRTGITASLVPYLGNRRDWVSLDNIMQGKFRMHPVEAFTELTFRNKHSLIMSDPTDLLKARAAVDQAEDHLWVVRSDVKEGVFQPILQDKPASLLWGEQLGFARRCSRGIISIPRSLLSVWPTIAGGVDGRGICLACGILSRNKGLDPSSFICNIQAKGTFRAFEEYSVFWPRPAKTLRSVFFREFERFFSLLGPVFVTLATELALLLTDAPLDVAEDWLDGHLEHQDLALNHEAHSLGADPDDLNRLYRGHYATMLISLSAHRVGVRIRPEILVYYAVCRSEGAVPGIWAASPSIQDRRQRELEALGPRVVHLVEAVV